MITFFEDLKKVDFYNKQDSLSLCNSVEKENLIAKLDMILKSEKKDKCRILIRGTKKSRLKEKLITKLNSDDSLYDGLFLVGDKAKIYLHKKENIPHPIRIINETGIKVAGWIFDEYSVINSSLIGTEYFMNPKNRNSFINKIKDDNQLIDYYLFGLHTWNSDSLLNFVSTTSVPSVALSNNNDLIIVLWLPENYMIHTVSKYTLDRKREKIQIEELPILENSLFEKEEEVAFKGFILPHFIVGVYDVQEKCFIVNPPLMSAKDVDWINEGFEIDGDAFMEFIKKTKYKRFLTLHNNSEFKEKTFTNRQ